MHITTNIYSHEICNFYLNFLNYVFVSPFGKTEVVSSFYIKRPKDTQRADWALQRKKGKICIKEWWPINNSLSNFM